jgi:nitrite reductase/ring-hydroxylating ferredoxin subunit
VSPPAPEAGFWNSLKVNKAQLAEKPRFPIILANGKSVMLWLVGDKVFCTAANGTALEYPLVDAELFTVDGRPAVRSKLDGSEYDLETGAVLKWCPKEDAAISLRNLLTAAKANAPAVPLPVYQTRVGWNGDIEALFTA